MFIDTHHHLVPPNFTEFLIRPGQEQAVYAERVRSWSPARAIEAMDQAGIEVAVASVAAAGGLPGDPSVWTTVNRSANDFSADVVRDQPRRFRFLAGLPLADLRGALEEVGYVLDELGADGFCLLRLRRRPTAG